MKKNGFKTLLLTLLALMLCVSLIACGDKKTGDNGTSAEPSESESVPAESSNGGSTSGEPEMTTEGLPDHVVPQGPNTNDEWGNDVIA